MKDRPFRARTHSSGARRHGANLDALEAVAHRGLAEKETYHHSAALRALEVVKAERSRPAATPDAGR